MPTLEMVEQLRKRANISYDEAKAALEFCGDDILEAMIYLEKTGRINPPQGGGYYTTQSQQPPQDPHGVEPGVYQSSGETFRQMMSRFWNWILKVINKGNTNSFEVWRNERRFINLPVTVLVLLVVFCPWVTLPLLVVGLFCRCKYRFCGPELSESGVNNVMENAAKAADDLKNGVTNMRGGGDQQ